MMHCLDCWEVIPPGEQVVVTTQQRCFLCEPRTEILTITRPYCIVCAESRERAAPRGLKS